MVSTNWLNSDGLYIKYGVNEGAPGNTGEFGEQAGNIRILEIRVPALTALTNTDAILDQNAYLGKNARIEWVEVLNIGTVTATSGGAATLSVGLMRTDQVTSLSSTAVLNAAPLTDWATVGALKRYTVGVTGAGGFLGTPASETNVTYFTAKWGTAAFTAGAISIRIGFSIP
jgi:hypothetical protein